METNRENPSVDDAKQPPTRKPYKSPKLEIYGGIGKIVATSDMVGAKDGGGGKFSRT